MSGTFNPRNRNDQRVLNYTAIFDEVEDFELNIHNVSGTGALAAPVACGCSEVLGVHQPKDVAFLSLYLSSWVKAIL